MRIIEETESLQVDIFGSLSGMAYADLEFETESSSLRGMSFQFASKSQLIAIKSSSVREKDQIDVSAMRQLLENPQAFD